MSNIINKIRLSGTDYTLSATTSGGTEAVEVTQAEYDALVSGGTVDPTVFYIITDAQPVDISNYWTSAQTNSAINAAVSGKQDTLSAGTGIDITDNVISATGGSITVDNALDDSSENPVQNKVLYDELRIVEGSDLVLEWENNDGGDTLNYPIGTSTLEFYVDESQMTYGHFDLMSNAEQGEVGGITIESNSGVITVSEEWSIDYTISGNVVTVSYPTVASTVDYLSSSYDCYWTVKAVNKTVTPLIDKVGEIEEVAAAALNNINDRLSEDEEVTAAGLNALNDAFGGLKLMKISQTDYDNLQVKDQNTLYVVI